MNKNTCKDCRQGYTSRDGYGAYPGPVWLCPLHSAAPELLKSLKDMVGAFTAGNTSQHLVRIRAMKLIRETTILPKLGAK